MKNNNIILKEDKINIFKIIKNTLNKYKISYVNEYIKQKKYRIFIDESEEKISNILNEYIKNCKEFNKNHGDLEIYEKSACLAIAIRNNPCLEMTDKSGILEYTILNNSFAIDTALKISEEYIKEYLPIDIDEIYQTNEELHYSKYLLASILENKYVYPNDISENLKLEISTIIKIHQYKKQNKLKVLKKY